MVIALVAGAEGDARPSETDEFAGAEPERRETPPRTGPPSPRWTVVLLGTALTLCAVALFSALFAFGLSGLQEQRSQHLHYSELRGLLDSASPEPPPLGGAIANGTPVAIVSAQAAGLHRVVVSEGTTSGDLLAGPGHLPNSPLPGQQGESFVLGKSTTAGAPFRSVHHLRPGALITVRTGQGLFHFVVIDQRTGGSGEHPVIRSGAVLTLVTSSGTGSLGNLTPGHLLYVDARLKGSPVNAPHGRPVATASSELPGQSEGGAWPVVLIWLIAVLLAAAGVWWMWARWGIWQTWLIGVPVLFALLWGFADAAMRLVPNVY